jgi:hypothetical protein
MSLTLTLGREEERLTVGGIEYRLTPPTLAGYRAVERELRRHLGSPLRRAAEYAASVPAAQAREYWAAAHAAEREWAEQSVETLMSHAPTEVRLASIAMLVLHRHHGDQIRTLDQAAAWLAQADLAEFDRSVQIILPPRPESGHRPTTAPQTGPV